MIAVVTGSTGFIGSHLVEALRAQGAEVRALRRPESGAAPAGVATHVVDLLDSAAVAKSAIWDGATHCFHLGGATKGRTRAEFARSNVDPTRHIAQAIAARGANGPRLVFLSSQAAAGPALHAAAPRREDEPGAPVEGYGASKLEAEKLIANSGAQLRATIVRAASVYGPGDRDFLQVFRQASGRIAVYAAPADQQFSIVHVRDLVSAIIAAGDRPRAVGRTYFVANVAPTSWREMYRTVARAAGAHPLELQIPVPILAAAAFVADLWPFKGAAAPLLTRHKVALSRPRWWLCDASRAGAELGWTPTIPLDAGLRETVDWYRDAGWLRGSATPQVVAA